MRSNIRHSPGRSVGRTTAGRLERGFVRARLGNRHRLDRRNRRIHPRTTVEQPRVPGREAHHLQCSCRRRPASVIGADRSAQATRIRSLPEDRKMIVTTTGSVPGKRIVRTLGLVRGNTIRARHVGRDIMAGLRGIVGGEISEYTKLFAQAREQASGPDGRGGRVSQRQRHSRDPVLDLDGDGWRRRAAGLRHRRRPRRRVS